MSNKFKPVDLKAPRFYQKRKNLVDSEFIKKFKEKYPVYKNMTGAEFNNILKAFNKNVVVDVIENRDGVKLPESVGTIFVGTCAPAKKYNVDYGLLNKENITSYHKNWETDGHTCKIFFTSYSEKYKYQFREFWVFKAHRNFKRTLSKEYPKNWTMYHKVNPSIKITEQFFKK